jgi:GntR family transcriptional regulator
MPVKAPYLRVADDLRLRIAAGDWAVGERLPGRGQLGEHYGVSPSVVQKAQERLIMEGLLEGRSGSGTYVRTPRQRLRMIRSRDGDGRQDSPLLADLGRLGMTGTWEARTQARVVPPPDIAARLAMDPNGWTVHTQYECFANGQPVHLSHSWEPMELTGDTPVLLPEAGPLAGKGVVARMRAIGVVVAYAAETPRPGRATQEQANLLGISVGDLVTHIERTYYDTGGRPVETANMTLPDARWDVTYEIPVDC